ncbi:MAG: mechanosensitive ion channel [Marinilabiliaceae bacterium]|nr:mechanosensitive ion channel [Marinilabiliaceae bacterium]
MKSLLTILAAVLLLSTHLRGQEVVNSPSNDSINATLLFEYQQRLDELERQRKADSLRREELEEAFKQRQGTDGPDRDELQKELNAITQEDERRQLQKKSHIESLRSSAVGYPVRGVMEDTLIYIYSKIGASMPKERALNISAKIHRLYDDDFLNVDSIIVQKSENSYDIVYRDLIVMSVSENDALWEGIEMQTLAQNIRDSIGGSIEMARRENSLVKTLVRVGLVLLVLGLAWLVFWLIGKGYAKLLAYVDRNKVKWLRNLSYKDYTFLTAEQEMLVVLFLLKIMRWFVYAILLYITLPIVFSIFPFSRQWADALFRLIWSPFRGVLMSVWAYLPNLFSILVIYVVMKYVIRFVKYVFHEIGAGKLEIGGFHADWAMPTYHIVRFLLYAFMFVLIFPYLPGSDSNIFKGVSVFIGVLFSLGSSSAIANMVAGLVITYMRPFKIGDRIKIGEVTGEVIEKTMLVTRVRTIKNEVITIPNSSILTGNTTNYSVEANGQGLIVYSTVTIGYDVPWRKVHQALFEAASRTDMILSEPQPFVLQTGLDDFYVSYQINAYTRESGKQALIYSVLHQNIQDVFNEQGIEIMSPHYRASRDGNATTVPADYLPKDYEAPAFHVKVKRESGGTGDVR